MTAPNNEIAFGVVNYLNRPEWVRGGVLYVVPVMYRVLDSETKAGMQHKTTTANLRPFAVFQQITFIVHYAKPSDHGEETAIDL